MIGGKKAYIISMIFLVTSALICVMFAMQIVSRGFVKIGGYSTFRVVTGSMEPAIATGSVLLCKETPIGEIKKGDIVCYRTRVTEIEGSIVTHRVVNILRDESENIYLETRGDANVSSDPHYVDAEAFIGKVTWHSGKESVVNKMLSFLSSKIGFLVCIVFPILLVSGLILQSSVVSLRKDIELVKRELQKEEAASEVLPGYTTLTGSDYEEIYETIRKELLEELNGKGNTETD